MASYVSTLLPALETRSGRQLLDGFTGDAEVERNRSLLASLRFSTSRLSAQAQAVLPWLGLFQRGVFEQILLRVSQIDLAAWDGVRAELETTALVRVETDIKVNDRPYLRFHPTLPYAVGGAVLADATASPANADNWRLTLTDQEDVRQRFIAVYHGFTGMIGRAFGGSGPHGGMERLAREEANVCTAVRWAVASDQFDVAAQMGSTLRTYLQMSARWRELDQWSDWLADAAAHTTFSEAVATVECDWVWSLFTQGCAAEAFRRLDALIERLQQTTAFDAAFQLAFAQSLLGRIYLHARQAKRAIVILNEVAGAWEQLVREAVNLSPSETIEDLLTRNTQEAKQQREASARQLGNLGGTLGDLAHALRADGRLDQALSMAEHSFDIARALGHDRDAVVGLGRMAHILMEQGRYQEANARCDQALEAARHFGDQELEGGLLQQKGGI